MIDVLIVQHTSDIEKPISPLHACRAIQAASFDVRSVTVLNANTGLTSTFRDDEVTLPKQMAVDTGDR